MPLSRRDVVKLYVAMFNRAPEKQGVDDWEYAAAQNGWDLGALAQSMLSAATQVVGSDPDYAAFYPQYVNLDTTDPQKVRAVIEEVYKVLFNKDYTVDPDGIDGWVNSVVNPQNPQPLGNAIASITLAAEQIAADPNYPDADARKAAQAYINKIDVAEEAANVIPDADIDNDGKIDFQEFRDILDVVTDDPQSKLLGYDKIQQIVDSTTGNLFVLTTNVDNIVGTYGNDIYKGETTTIGTADVVVDPSTTDHDVFDITATTDLPAFTVSNVEDIRVKLDTLGGTQVDASRFSNATITVWSDRFGFSGAATIANLGSNKAVAGDNVTNLTVNNIASSGVVDAGNANQINATVVNNGDLNLIVHKDVKLTALNTEGDLKITANADATVDVTTITFNNAAIDGTGSVTIKTDAAEITGETVTKNTTAEVTIELTNSDSGNDSNNGSGLEGDGTNDVDLTNMDIDRVVLDEKFMHELIFDTNIVVDATQSGNTAIFTGPAADGVGGSTGGSMTLNLLKAADGSDTYTFERLSNVTLNAQNGGVVKSLTSKNGSVSLTSGKDIEIETVDLANQALEITGNTAGKVNLGTTALDVAAIIASDLTHDLTINQTADKQIAIVGSKAKNSITTAATDKSVSIITQNSDDTINANKITSGALSIDTAGGDDTVTAINMTTSTASIVTGDGMDEVTLKNGDSGKATVSLGGGDDKLTINGGAAGEISVDAGAGNDLIDADYTTGTLADTATVTISAEDGDDIVKIHSSSPTSKETISINGGDGIDIVEVGKEADFSDASLTLDNIEELKIDIKATFNDDQLNDKTFKVSSGTSNTDQLIVELTPSLSIDNENRTNLGDLQFSTSTATKVEYVKIDATASASDDMIIGAHYAANVIDLGADKGKETLKLFADAIGTTINNLNVGSPQPDITVTDLTGIDTTKVSFNIAVIENFDSANDSLILGNAATATNYTEVAIDFNSTGGAPNAGVEDFLEDAITKANNMIANDSNLEYVYVYDDGQNGAEDYAFLLWDSDHNGSVDAAILLVGVETNNDGTGFAASDIVAG